MKKEIWKVKLINLDSGICTEEIEIKSNDLSKNPNYIVVPIIMK
jgi:hypothetical protein